MTSQVFAEADQEELRELRRRLQKVDRELEAVLSAGPSVRVRHLEAGAENLAESVAVTMAKLRSENELLRKKLEEAQATICGEFCDNSGHSPKCVGATP